MDDFYFWIEKVFEIKPPRSLIGKHMKQHGVDKPIITDNFSVLNKVPE